MLAIISKHIRDKVKSDNTRCLMCKRPFKDEDARSNVYIEDKLVGVVHENCYERSTAS